jgi:hypothetical protein
VCVAQPSTHGAWARAIKHRRTCPGLLLPWCCIATSSGALHGGGPEHSLLVVSTDGAGCRAVRVLAQQMSSQFLAAVSSSCTAACTAWASVTLCIMCWYMSMWQVLWVFLVHCWCGLGMLQLLTLVGVALVMGRFEGPSGGSRCKVKFMALRALCNAPCSHTARVLVILCMYCLVGSFNKTAAHQVPLAAVVLRDPCGQQLLGLWFC